MRVPALAALVVLAANAATAAERRPIATVNHFFAVVDADTAAAIAQSPFLREVANLDVHSTSTPGGRHWTGRYLRGRQTYVEFFAPGDLGDENAPVGSIGLGVGGDRQGAVRVMAGRLHEAGLPVPVTMTRRLVDGHAVDWFWTLDLPDMPSGGANLPTADTWAMEYVPTYFEQPGARREPPEGSAGLVSRERYLDDLYRDHLIRDVEEADFSLTADQYRVSFAPLLAAAGFSVDARPDGVVATSMGVTLRLHFVAPAEVGLNRIVFSLNRETTGRAQPIGHSCLEIGAGARAVWRFRPVGGPCGAVAMAEKAAK